MKVIIRFATIILYSAIFIFITTTVDAQAEAAKNLPNFLLPEFTGGILKLKSGQVNTAVLNYNVVDQEMVFLQNDIYMVMDNPQLVDTIFLANRTFIPFNTGFYELVMTGTITLFIQHKSNVESVGATTGYGATSKTLAPSYVRQIYGPAGSINLRIPDEFKVVDISFYWVRKESSMEKFSTKHQFLKIFRDKGKELNNFIDSNRINFKNLSDIVKLFNYCNELYK